MMLLAVDPGTTESAFCLMDEKCNVHDKGKIGNDQLLQYIMLNAARIDHLACEMVACYGMAVGAEVFETCTMIGKIERTAELKGIPHSRIFRTEEKMCICYSVRANDSNIRRALIDRFAKHDMERGIGTKNSPDHFYGFKKDIWAAFAVGVTYLDKVQRGG